VSSFFPVPPTINIRESSLEIYGSTTFLNIPNNRLKDTIIGKSYNKIIYLGLYALEKCNWSLIKIFKTYPYEYAQVERKDFEVYPNQMLVLVPQKNNNFPKTPKKLPKPDSLRIDKSPVAERCSLNFYFKKSITSYQGEYPFEMASLEKSSFLSFDALKQTYNSKEVVNFIIFMNINVSSDLQGEVKINVFNPCNKSLKKEIIAKRNSFTIHRIQEENNREKINSVDFYTSKDSSFIPINLTLNLKTNQLSAEHTHPPTELFYGLNKMDGVRLLKKTWL
tara:strand:- start:667 stop:1503 length:837 start_codon:yes stop_codon:yes gene_type:complete